jgi:hypothetical protein
MAQTMLLQDREAPITKPRRQPRRLPARCRYDHMTASSLAALRFGAASYGHSLDQCCGFCAGNNLEARVEVGHPTFVYIGKANARGPRLLS